MITADSQPFNRAQHNNLLLLLVVFFCYGCLLAKILTLYILTQIFVLRRFL